MADQPFLASNSFNGDGVTTVWEFSFEGLSTDAPLTAVPYIDPSDVRAEFITGEGDEQVTVQQDVVLVTGNSLELPVAPPVGTVLRIYRVTENRFPLVNYQDLQSVGASDLDLANRQAVYIVQEARDAARGAGNIQAEAIAIAQGAAQEAAADAEAAAIAATAAAGSAASAEASAAAVAPALVALTSRVDQAEADIDDLQADAASAAADLAALGEDVSALSALNVSRDQITRVNKNVATSKLGVSPINILGDSISHGAFALNLFTEGYVNLFKRMAHAEYGVTTTGGAYESGSYGFVPWFNVGSGGTLSLDIHAANSISGFTTLTNSGAPNSLAGATLRATAVGGVIDISVPTFMRTLRLFYYQQPGGGSFDVVSVNTAVVESAPLVSINTDGALDYFRYVDVPIVDNGRGTFRYRVKITAAGVSQPVELVAGASYLANVERSVVNNFSNSGRRLTEASEVVIQEAIRGAQMFICALSHNDAADAETVPGYLASFQQRIDWIVQYANLYGTPVVFLDFCWTQPRTSAVRTALRRVIDECNGMVVDYPSHFRLDGAAASSAYLISTLGLFTDAAHPNGRGHQIIAEKLAKELGLSVSSKREALEFHDWWMPLSIDGASNTKNAGNTYRTVSAVRRNGSVLCVRLSLREAADANPFPVGVRNIQTAWPTKYAYVGQLPQTVSVGLQYVSAGGALSTQCDVTPGGTVRINQLVTNLQDITGSLVGAAV